MCKCFGYIVKLFEKEVKARAIKLLKESSTPQKKWKQPFPLKLCSSYYQLGRVLVRSSDYNNKICRKTPDFYKNVSQKQASALKLWLIAWEALLYCIYLSISIHNLVKQVL